MRDLLLNSELSSLKHHLTVFMGQESGHDLAGSFAQGLKNYNQGISWAWFLSGAGCPLLSH